MSNDNNGNGNGHEPKFGLKPIDDPILKSVVPTARRNVVRDHTLPRGARMMFAFITDWSLWTGHNVRPGVMRMSNFDLSQHLGCSISSVQKWKRLLVSRGHIFITEQWLKNSWPRTVYNVVCIVGQEPLRFTEDEDEGYVAEEPSVRLSNKVRYKPVSRYDGPDREHRGKFLSRDGTFCPKSEKKSQNAAVEIVTGNSLRAPHAPYYVPRTHEETCPPRTKGRAPHAPPDVPAAQNGADTARMALRATHAPPDVPRTHAEADKGETQDVSVSVSERTFERSTELNAQKRGGGARKSPENRFLYDSIEGVKAVMESWKTGHSEIELSGSGPWWRLAYRADARLARAVLNEVGSMIKRGSITDTPGAAAVDLWKRLGGPALSLAKFPKAREAVGK